MPVAYVFATPSEFFNVRLQAHRLHAEHTSGCANSRKFTTFSVKSVIVIYVPAPGLLAKTQDS